MSEPRKPPSREIRRLALVVGGLAMLVLAYVIVTNAMIVTRLRVTYGVTGFNLVEPLMLLPAVGLAAAAWTSRAGRDRAALVLAGLALGVATLFWYVQTAARFG